MLAGPDRKQQLNPRGPLFSILAHALIALAVAVAIHLAPRVAPFRLPGTAKGLTLLTYYSPGSRKPVASDSSVHSKHERPTHVAGRKSVDTLAPPAPARADAGSAGTQESGLGEGDIRIALQQHFPSPQPDLSVLPHGTAGEVVLDAVIDEHGRISTLTLLKGLAPSIDTVVMATVRQWIFTPATKDGVPVASEQEFHFHYERG